MGEMTAIVNPTQRQVVQAQERAIDRGRQLADSITGVSTPNQALIREILPSADLESGANNNWSASNRDWVQTGMTQDAENTVYNINSNGAAQDKVLVFYGLYNIAGDPATTEVIFNDGTGATFARFNVEALEVAEVSDFIIFDDDIVYGSTEDGDLLQWPDSSNTDSLVYLCKVVEPLGETLSTRERPENRLVSGGGGR